MTYTINILGRTLKRLLARVVPLLVLRIDLQFPLTAMCGSSLSVLNLYRSVKHVHLRPEMVMSCISALHNVVDTETIISDTNREQTSNNGDCGHSGRLVALREAVAEAATDVFICCAYI